MSKTEFKIFVRLAPLGLLVGFVGLVVGVLGNLHLMYTLELVMFLWWIADVIVLLGFIIRFMWRDR